MKPNLHELRRRLGPLGFFQRYLTFGDGNLRPWDWAYAAERLTGELAIAWRFLLCHEVFSVEELSRVLGVRSMKGLLKSGLAQKVKSGISLQRHSLVTFQQKSFFVDLAPDSRLAFSEDTKALAASVPTEDFSKALIIYTSCAAECLALNHTPEREVTFLHPEGDPELFQSAWELNSCLSKFKFATGTGLKRSQTFDLILARIPSWSLPPALSDNFFRPGGQRGTDEMDKCLELVAQKLTSDGACAFTCILYGADSVDPAWLELTEKASRLGLVLTGTCSSRQALEPGIPIFNHLIGTVQYKTGKPTSKILEALINHYCDQKMSHAHFLRGTMKRSAGGLGHSLLNLSDRYYGNWSI